MNDDRKFLLMAFEEAERAKLDGTFPIGSILVDQDGNVISKGRNRVFYNGDTTAHAEVEAIRNAGPAFLDMKNKKYISPNFTLYTTCEPCPLCTGAIIMSKIKRVVWAANDADNGAVHLMKQAFLVNLHLKNKFDRLEICAAPFPDLEERQRRIHAEWNASRGIYNKSWL
jgi:tRNA(adenine34) deaminase